MECQSINVGQSFLSLAGPETKTKIAPKTKQDKNNLQEELNNTSISQMYRPTKPVQASLLVIILLLLFYKHSNRGCVQPPFHCRIKVQRKIHNKCDASKNQKCRANGMRKSKLFPCRQE